MSRPPLPVGSWGRIARAETSPGHWRASARVRDYDGKTRQVMVWGATGAAAERALVVLLNHRVAPTREDVTPETRVRVLTDVWLTGLTAEGRLAAPSIQKYRGLVRNHVLPGLGALRLREVTPGRLDRFLRVIAAEHPTQAQRVRGALVQLFALAVRHDARVTNPARDLGPLPRPQKKTVRALTLDDLAAVRDAVRSWRSVPDEDGHLPSGPRPTDGLADVVDLMLGTGLRIGEVLALRWVDIDLGAERPTLTVDGTLTYADGLGLQRKPTPKTASGRRTLFLPNFVVEVLLRHHLDNPANPHGAVFATRKGTWVSPNNVRRQWRACRVDTGLEWVTPHVFRKTVATLVDSTRGLDAASKQLGHHGTQITSKHYIVAKPNVAPDLADVLEQLGPVLNAYSTEMTAEDDNLRQ